MVRDARSAVEFPWQVATGEVPLQPGNREQIEAAIPNVVDLAGFGTAPKLVEPRGLKPTRARQSDRLIASGGGPVKVGELSAQQLADIKKVVPKAAARCLRRQTGLSMLLLGC